MTEEQKRKTQWLNRAYYADRKIESLKKLREVNEKYRDETTESQIKRDTERINIELTRIMKYKDEIENAIAEVKDDELEAILNMRYLCYMNVSEIADTMFYDRKTIQRKHLKALDRISCPIMSQ